jgi:hypothetical protein
MIRFYWFDRKDDDDHSMCAAQCSDPDCTWNERRVSLIALCLLLAGGLLLWLAS